jgi:hypothetical protein
MEVVVMEEPKKPIEEIEKIQEEPLKTDLESVVTYREKMRKLREKRFGVDGKISEP